MTSVFDRLRRRRPSAPALDPDTTDAPETQRDLRRASDPGHHVYASVAAHHYPALPSLGPTPEYTPQYIPEANPAATNPPPPPPPPDAGAPLRRVSTGRDELPLIVRDAVFTHQFRQPPPAHPLSITPATMVTAQVCAWTRDAETVHRALVKCGVLTTAPSDSKSSSTNASKSSLDAVPHLPATARITAALPRQVKVLYRPDVKQLVKLLFFWEEEVVRWRVKDDEQAELERIAEGLRGKVKALEGAVVREQSQGEEGDGRQNRAEDGVGEAVGAAPQDSASPSPPSPRGATMTAEDLTEERDRLGRMLREVELRIHAVNLRKRVKPSERTIQDQLPVYCE